MFAYCKNVVVNRIDSEGYKDEMLAGGGGAIAGGSISPNGLGNAVGYSWDYLSNMFKAMSDKIALTFVSVIVNSNSKTKSQSTTKPTKKGVLKRAKLPVKGKIRYVPPKNWTASQPLPKMNEGFVDEFGNVWSKGPSRTAGQSFEWDVQLSKTGQSQLGQFSRDGSHLNVSLDGRITHK